VAGGASVNESSLQNNGSMDQFDIKGVQHMSANGYSSVSHANDARHFMVEPALSSCVIRAGPHSNNRTNPTMSYPRQQMTLPPQDIAMNHCTQADQDQAGTNVCSNPEMEVSVMKQYHEHLYGIAAQHNDTTTSSQSSIHGQFIPQLQHLPQPHFCHESHFVPSQMIQHHGVHPEQQHHLQHHQITSDPPLPGVTPHLETILPLSGDFLPDGANGISVAGQPSSDYGIVPETTCPIQTSTFSQSTWQQKKDQEIIAGIFGPSGDIVSSAEKGDGDILQSLNNMSIGNGDNLDHHNVNWGLGVLYDGTSTTHSVGLGGVRLDWSTDVPHSGDHEGKSPWGSQ